MRDIANYIRPNDGSALLGFTASSTSNGDPQTGLTIDQEAIKRRYKSLAAVLHGTLEHNATTSASKAVTASFQLQDSPTSTTWTNLGSAVSATPKDPKTTGTTSTGGANAFMAGFDLMTARRYVRVNTTITMPASSAGSAQGFCGKLAMVFGTADEVPST